MMTVHGLIVAFLLAAQFLSGGGAGGAGETGARVTTGAAGARGADDAPGGSAQVASSQVVAGQAGSGQAGALGGAQDPVILFEQANLLLAQGRAQQALDLYRGIQTEGMHSGALAFNMGVALQQLDSLGSAKALLLLAERLPETRTQAKEALRQLEGSLPAQIAKVPRHPWQSVYDALILEWGVGKTLFLFGLSLYGLSIGGILILMRRFVRPARYIALLSGGFAFILGLVLWTYVSHSRNYREGVIRVSITALYEHPDSGPIENRVAYEGFLVREDRALSEPHAGWSYISLENGSRGWVREQDIAFIPSVRR